MYTLATPCTCVTLFTHTYDTCRAQLEAEAQPLPRHLSSSPFASLLLSSSLASTLHCDALCNRHCRAARGCCAARCGRRRAFWPCAEACHGMEVSTKKREREEKAEIGGTALARLLSAAYCRSQSKAREKVGEGEKGEEGHRKKEEKNHKTQQSLFFLFFSPRSRRSAALHLAVTSLSTSSPLRCSILPPVTRRSQQPACFVPFAHWRSSPSPLSPDRGTASTPTSISRRWSSL